MPIIGIAITPEDIMKSLSGGAAPPGATISEQITDESDNFLLDESGNFIFDSGA